MMKVTLSSLLPAHKLPPGQTHSKSEQESVPLCSRRIRRGKLWDLNLGLGGWDTESSQEWRGARPPGWITALVWNEFPAHPASNTPRTVRSKPRLRWGVGWGQGCLGLPGEVGCRESRGGVQKAPRLSGVPALEPGAPQHFQFQVTEGTVAA